MDPLIFVSFLFLISLCSWSAFPEEYPALSSLGGMSDLICDGETLWLLLVLLPSVLCSSRVYGCVCVWGTHGAAPCFAFFS